MSVEDVLEIVAIILAGLPADVPPDGRQEAVADLGDRPVLPRAISRLRVGGLSPTTRLAPRAIDLRGRRPPALAPPGGLVSGMLTQVVRLAVDADVP